jgi:hypothetical protein
MPDSSADGGEAAGLPRGAGWPARLVWIIWAAMTLLALVATAAYGRWLPWSDDFDLVPYVTGDRPVTAGWLWEQHNEHRIPLVKLLLVGLGRLSGADYRWTVAIHALILSATAAAMILAARRLRGHSAWTDAVFPAVLLHLGQAALVWAFQTPFVLTTVLGCLFVAAAVAAPRTAACRAAALGTLACLMPLTGSAGLVLAAAAAALLAAEALWPDRAAGGPQSLPRGIAAAGAGLTLAVAIAYVATLRLGPTEGYAGPWRTLVASLDTLASYPGSPVARMRLPWLFVTCLAIGGTLAAAARPLFGKASSGTDRRAGISLLGYLAALALVAVAIGYGRGTRDFTPLYGHYATLALGVPLALGLVWAMLPQTAIARSAQAVLCLTALVVFAVHARRAVRNWSRADESWAVIASDMRGDLPPEDVAARHAAALYFVDVPEVRQKIATCVTLLRRTRFPLYCSRPATLESAPP